MKRECERDRVIRVKFKRPFCRLVGTSSSLLPVVVVAATKNIAALAKLADGGGGRCGRAGIYIYIQHGNTNIIILIVAKYDIIMLLCWRVISARVPNSVCLLRSPSPTPLEGLANVTYTSNPVGVEYAV